MVKTFKKAVFGLAVLSAATIFFSCASDSNSDSTPAPQTKEKKSDPESPTVIKNDLKDGKRNANLDLIFNPDIVGTTTITITRQEWNELLENYDLWFANETYVKAKDYKFEKKGSDGKDYGWEFKDIGFRLRGNTSRIRPQLGNGAGNDDYIQAHFKISFEEYVEDGYEAKMAGCMKGVNLKRFRNDASYVGEVFCYNNFRANGVWTAPRAAYTHLILKIEDTNSTETVDYGIYEMVEEINKQYLKARDGSKHFGTDEGNLWKCAYAQVEVGELWHGSRLVQGITCPTPKHGEYCSNETFGVEKKEFNEDKTEYLWERYNYDLKTNKKKLETAKK